MYFKDYLSVRMIYTATGRIKDILETEFIFHVRRSAIKSNERG